MFTRSDQIRTYFLQWVMRNDLFVDKRYNISRISDTYKKSFICILLKYCYIRHNNFFCNIRLICETCDDILGKLCRHKLRSLGRLIVINILWTFLQLVKLLTTFGDQCCCSRRKFRIDGQKASPTSRVI